MVAPLKEEEQNRLILHSGHQYSTVPTHREDPTPGRSGYIEPLPINKQTNMPSNTPPPGNNPEQPPSPPLHNAPALPLQYHPAAIRVIPTNASICQFGGMETDFSARQFLDLCESAIVNSSITEDHDKITFIRSCLPPGSRALNLMQSSAFAAGDIGVNYVVFKRNFIKKFWGVANLASLSKWPHGRRPPKQFIHKANLERHD